MTNMDILKIIIENVNEEGYCPYGVLIEKSGLDDEAIIKYTKPLRLNKYIDSTNEGFTPLKKAYELWAILLYKK